MTARGAVGEHREVAEHQPKDTRGPFRVHHVRSGDRYELVDGHPVYCAPTGGDGARGALAGGQVLGTDPGVTEAGFDPGYTDADDHLRAPDLAVGHVPDAPGWIRGAPPLAVEYAGTGQDEVQLQKKIAELLVAGTRYVWVVRLVGPRRIEVHQAGQPVRTVGPGEVLTAPGVLQNPVPVEAMYDRDAAHAATLRNLLNRRGYESLDQVRDEGRDEGRREALRLVLEARFGPLPNELRARIGAASSADLDRLLSASAAAADLEGVFG